MRGPGEGNCGSWLHKVSGEITQWGEGWGVGSVLSGWGAEGYGDAANLSG